MAERAVWKGAISLGLLLVPISLVKAVGSHDTLFHEYHAADGGSIGRKSYCKDCGQDVSSDGVIKGISVGKGQAPVYFTDTELENLPSSSSKAVTLIQFVSEADLSPLLYETTYYVVPEEIGIKPYNLLLKNMNKRVAVGKITLRSRESLCALRVYNGMFLLSTLCYSDELRQTPSIPSCADINDAENDLMQQVIGKFTGSFQHDAHVDTYVEAIKKLAQDKLSGNQSTAYEQKVETKAPSLEDALKALLG